MEEKSNQSESIKPYRTYMKEDYEALIDSLDDLNDFHKHCIKSRWLDQLLWLDNKATRSQKRYHIWRLIAVIGGILVPFLVNLSFQGTWGLVTKIITSVVSLSVAISAGIEELFQYGNKWRIYRSSAEGMKMEGWEFFQLVGPYVRFKTHSQAYPKFAARVEEIMKKDLDVYISDVAGEKEEKEDERSKVSLPEVANALSSNEQG